MHMPHKETNVIDLVSFTHSSITNVKLHPRRAEVTRLFKFPVKCGSNRINITGLPTVADKDSLRVEGNSNRSAIIRNVTISETPRPTTTTSPTMKALLLKRAQTEKVIERLRDSLSCFRTYLDTLNSQKTDVIQLTKILEAYGTFARPIDNKVLQATEQLSLIDKEIEDDPKNIAGQTFGDALRIQVGIDVSSTSNDNVEITVVYAVDNANWNARYDVRVDTDTTSGALTSVIYQASISQNTAEPWENVPLTLETFNPTFGTNAPILNPWNIHLQQRYHNLLTVNRTSTAPQSSEPSQFRGVRPQALIPDEEPNMTRSSGPKEPEAMTKNLSSVTPSKGIFSATFHVPDLITIPSDGSAHNVVITQLTLSGSLSWIAVPKRDPRAYLKAKIINNSEFPLLKGIAHVFVDGSFTCKSSMPAVSPQETFDLDLGVDSSLRIAYHPRSSHSTETERYWRPARTQAFTQLMTVFNSKTIAVKVKVIDQIPVTEDPNLTVKLTSPPLTVPDTPGASKHTVKDFSGPTIDVGKGIIAQWEGSDELDPESLGKDGKVSWVFSLQPQEKAHLTLEWELTSTDGRHAIVGL